MSRTVRPSSVSQSADLVAGHVSSLAPSGTTAGDRDEAPPNQSAVEHGDEEPVLSDIDAK